NTCVPTGGMTMPCSVVPQCTAADLMNGTRFCVNGVVRYLKDDSCSAGKTFQVLAFDPIQFLLNPGTAMPKATTTTDANGGYKLGGLKDDSGFQLIAIAVIDQVDGMGTFIMSGSGAQGVTPNNTYRVDLYAVEKALVASWD